MDSSCNTLQGIDADISMQIEVEDLVASLIHWRCGTSQRWNMVVFWWLIISSLISASRSRKHLLGAVPGFDDLFSRDLA